jgi:uncharacterized protein (TIGR02001 family)
MFKKVLVAGFVSFATLIGFAHAAAPASPHTLSGNVGLYSQYVFRGLAQTDRDPALQGGFDYGHSSGFYVGTWASNISWLRDAAPSSYSSGGSLEMDFYGGFKGDIGKSGLSYDAGLLYYYYPGSIAAGSVKADTLELYTGLGWKWLSAKFSYGLNKKTFGVIDSRGTWYLDLGAAVPLGNSGVTLDLHYGKQKYRGAGGTNDTLFSYNDWKVGVSYALPQDFTIGAYYTDTSSANPLGYGSVAQGGAFPRNITDGTGTIYISKSF